MVKKEHVLVPLCNPLILSSKQDPWSHCQLAWIRTHFSLFMLYPAYFLNKNKCIFACIWLGANEVKSCIPYQLQPFYSCCVQNQVVLVLSIVLYLLLYWAWSKTQRARSSVTSVPEKEGNKVLFVFPQHCSKLVPQDQLNMMHWWANDENVAWGV